MEYARAATTAMSKRKSDPRAALEAVAAAPQPSCPASAKVALSAAANHMRLRTANPEKTGSNQDPRAIAVVEGNGGVGRRPDLWLIAIDHVRDDEQADGLYAARAPQAFPERRGGVHV